MGIILWRGLNINFMFLLFFFSGNVYMTMPYPEKFIYIFMSKINFSCLQYTCKSDGRFSWFYSEKTRYVMDVGSVIWDIVCRKKHSCNLKPCLMWFGEIFSIINIIQCFMLLFLKSCIYYKIFLEFTLLIYYKTRLYLNNFSKETNSKIYYPEKRFDTIIQTMTDFIYFSEFNTDKL